MSIQNVKKSISVLCIAITICAVMVCAAPKDVYASSPTDAGVLELTSSKNLSGNGYSWNAKTQTLTLTNANLIGAIDIPDTGDVTIILNGENHISQGKKYHNVIYGGTSKGGVLTIKSDGTGSLDIDGYIRFGNWKEINIESCILSVSVNEYDVPQYAFDFYGVGNLNIRDHARVIVTGCINGGSFLTVDDYSSLEINCLYDIQPFPKNEVDYDAKIINGSELHISFPQYSGFALIAREFYADETSVVEILCEKTDDALRVDRNIDIQSKYLNIKAKDAALSVSKFSDYSVITLPDAIQDDYVRDQVFSAEGELFYHPLRLFSREDGTQVREISYMSDEYIAEQEGLKDAVESASITLRSSYTTKNNIKLTWTKPADVDMDYYEVFRSTKRYSGFTNTPFYTTEYGIKNYYTNTKDMKRGTMYYYKVRGVKVIDSEKVYTPWSTKAWRRAK